MRRHSSLGYELRQDENTKGKENGSLAEDRESSLPSLSSNIEEQKAKSIGESMLRNRAFIERL